MRNVMLSEMIKELEENLEKNGDSEILSVGTSSGINSSFILRTNTEKEIRIKCIRK